MSAPRRLLVTAAVCLATLSLPPLDAQVRPIYDRGAAGLTQLLQRLQTTASALHTGAHPDDEDSGFIARTARGDHARVGYLSLTRGEGGQNIIGTELFEALGVIRTEELLQARRLDGGEQFFTRAIDYGFSKTRAEAAAKWNEREVLGDMVRVLRAFRPLVVVSRFSGTGADGHGHHQLAGYLTPLAFRAAGDPAQFPEHAAEGLRPWQPRKLYRSVRPPFDASGANLELLTGALDPVLGRTYQEIAAEGRSQHKSQEMGTIEPRGLAWSYVRLLQRPGTDAASPNASPEPLPQFVEPRETSIFDGLDTSLQAIPALVGLPAGALRPELDAVARFARQALDDYEPLAPSQLVPTLAQGLQATRAARRALATVAADAAARADADFLLSIKEADFSEALARAAGLVIDALADRETVAQGSSVSVTIRAFYPDASLVRVAASGLTVPEGWTVAPRPPAGDGLVPGAERSQYDQPFTVAVPAEAEVTQPYYLATARQGDRYVWDADTPRSRPFAPGPLEAWVRFEAAGVSATIDTRVDYRFGDRVRGEVRRNVNVVPPVTVTTDAPLLIVPTGSGSSGHRITVTATSHVQRGLRATVRLRAPSGWTSAPGEAAVQLASAGDRASASFLVTPPARRMPGHVEIVAEVSADGRAYTQDLQTISYPHIETHRLFRPAATRAEVLDLRVAPVRVGYLMGSGDQVPEALRRMGVDVTLLDNGTIMNSDLGRFDTIVVGVRASEARPDFVNEHARLMRYVMAGGTLVVQYQQYDYVNRNLPPYPAAQPPGTGNSRVTDETAPVTILAPAHPVFTYPNRITAADFDGWVQERNLYAFPVVDGRYTPLLETMDPGEAAQRGGQVYAEIGKGRYVYSAYSWFRQLPAGVPGAYRLFANLISLPRAPR
jgi:LmbE family N-acetylglucosaminyl deacetylase